MPGCLRRATLTMIGAARTGSSISTAGTCIRAAACALVLLIFGVDAPAAEDIGWSSGRALRWADFVGRVDADAPPENIAATAASLTWTYGYETVVDGGACSYRITTAHAEAVFHPHRSWVRPNHATADVLRHEQGHFDITQIHKLMFDALVAPLIDATYRCEGRTRRQISARVEAEIRAQLEPIYDDVWDNHLRTQAAYDAETHHGSSGDPQAAWTRAIEAGIRTGSWTAFRR
jgi:hypothetical protein